MRERVTVVCLSVCVSVCPSVCPDSSNFISGLYDELSWSISFLWHSLAMQLVDFGFYQEKSTIEWSRAAVRRPCCHTQNTHTFHALEHCEDPRNTKHSSSLVRTQALQQRVNKRFLGIPSHLASYPGPSFEGPGYDSKCAVEECVIAWVCDKAEGFALQCLIEWVIRRHMICQDERMLGYEARHVRTGF